MAYTLSQLQAVETVITGGTSEVEIDGRKVRYYPLDQLLQLRAVMQSELGVGTPAAARGRAWRPSVSNGL